MSVGTLATIGIISAGASAGASIYGAKKQADSAKTASAQQQQAAKDAQAAQTPLYNRALEIAQQQAAQGQARLDPYASQGGAGLTALSAFLGVPQPSGGPNPALSPLAPTPSQQASANAFMPTAVANANNPPTGGPVPANARPMNVYGATGYSGPGQANGLPLQGAVSGAPRPAVPQGPGPGMVTLRAPNGQTQQVPADHAEYYVARGATRV
jgi:hypothetical protein